MEYRFKEQLLVFLPPLSPEQLVFFPSLVGGKAVRNGLRQRLRQMLTESIINYNNIYNSTARVRAHAQWYEHCNYYSKDWDDKKRKHYLCFNAIVLFLSTKQVNTNDKSRTCKEHRRENRP